MISGLKKCSGCRSVLLTFILLVSVRVANAQENQSITLAATGASGFSIHNRSDLYEVHLVIRNTSAVPLTLRKCGTDPSTLRICTYDIHVEHLQSGRWGQSTPPEPLGDTGIKAIEHIDPGNENTQLFKFLPTLWGIYKGERVRIVFGLFNSEGRRSAARYVTPSFVIK
jgi:hypothetical protein